MPKRTYRLNDFSGGLNWKRDPRDIADNELVRADFCYIDRVGGIRSSGVMNMISSGTDLPDITHTAGAGYYTFESDHMPGASAKDTGVRWLVGIDGLDGTMGAYALTGVSTSTVSTGVDLGSVDSTTWTTNQLNFSGSVISLNSGTAFDDANLQAGDFIQISGATTDTNRNCYAFIKFASDDELFLQGSIASTGGNEAGNVTIKRLIRPSFFDSADDLRIADASMSASAKRQKYSYIKNIHFEDAGAAKNSYDDWYANDCSLNAPTELLLHATSYPTAGAGFHLTMTSTAGGSLPSKTYQIAGSFIYENGQESLLYIPSSSNTVAVTSNHYLDIDVRAENTADLTDGVYDERITGARVYIRENGTSDAWTLAVDISMKDGARTTLDSEYSPWVNNSAVQAKVEGLQLKSENLETYTILNGFGPDEFSIQLASNGEGYKDAIIANRRVFACNVSMIDEFGDGTETIRMRDRIMYTPINKFDTFPRSFFIDVVQGDADEYTGLATYADRLFAFKKNTLYIINISSPSPSNWFLESTERGKGIHYPCGVWTSKDGIYWANVYGVYWYNGSNIINLTENKLPNNVEVSGNSFALSFMPMVWYSDELQMLFVRQQVFSSDTGGGAASNATHGGTWVYNFASNGWTRIRKDNNGVNDNVFYSNIIESNNSYYVGKITQNKLDGTIETTSNRRRMDDALAANTKVSVQPTNGSQVVITKDIDFGDTFRLKKVYSVVITYKSNTTFGTPVSYAINGSSSFSSSFVGSMVGTGQGDYTDNWAKQRFTLASPVECQSMKIKIENTSSGSFQINDIAIEYRPIYKRSEYP